MGKIQVPGGLSGRTYDVLIAGDAPTDEEIARAGAMINEREQAFAAEYEQQFGQPLNVDDGTAFGRGWDRGKTSAFGSLGTAVRDVGEATGFDFLQNLGGGMEDRAQRERLREQAALTAPTNWQDVGGIGDFLTYAGEVAGQSGPEMAATLTATGAGGLVGGLPGAFAAGTTVATPFFYGRNIQRQEGQIDAGELESKDRFNAFLAAGGSAVLNTVADKILLGAGRLAKPGQNLFTRIAAAGAEGAAVEIPTEITQQLLERAQAGLPLDDEEAIKEYIDVGIAAGVLGGGIGGARGPFIRAETAATPPAPAAATPPAPAAATPPAPAAAPAPQSVTAADAGLPPDILEELAAEESSATLNQRTAALLNQLGVSPNAGMRSRLSALNAAPDSPEVLGELAKYRKVHAANAQLREASPDAGRRIDEYLANTTPRTPTDPALDPTQPITLRTLEALGIPKASPTYRFFGTSRREEEATRRLTEFAANLEGTANPDYLALAARVREYLATRPAAAPQAAPAPAPEKSKRENAFDRLLAAGMDEESATFELLDAEARGVDLDTLGSPYAEPLESANGETQPQPTPIDQPASTEGAPADAEPATDAEPVGDGAGLSAVAPVVADGQPTGTGSDTETAAAPEVGGMGTPSEPAATPAVPAESEPAALTPGPALWASADVDIPVNIADVAPMAGPDGRMYQQVSDPETGAASFVPLDEIVQTAPAAAPAAPSTKKRDKQLKPIRDYFTPGNIVESYGGFDRVLSFDVDPTGEWTVTVEPVKQVDGQWVKDTTKNPVRTHSTTPDKRKRAKGPIARSTPPAPAPAPDTGKLRGWLEDNYDDSGAFMVDPASDPDEQALGLKEVRGSDPALAAATDAELRSAVEAALRGSVDQPGFTVEPQAAKTSATAEQASMDFGPEAKAEADTTAAVGKDVLKSKVYKESPALRQAYHMQTPLTGAEVDAVRRGNVKAALDSIAARIADPQVSALARTIAKNIGATKSAVINPADPNVLESETDVLKGSYGIYYTTQDTIVLNEDIGLTTSALLHEALHAVTLAELRKPNSQLRAGLQQVLDAVQDSIAPYMPGEVTVEEFAAEAKTNPDLRTRLAQLNAKGLSLPPQANGGSVLEWIKSLLGKFVKALGRTTGQPTALAQADALIDMAVTPERNSAPDVLYSKRLGSGNYAIMDSFRAITEATARDGQNMRQKLADDASGALDGVTDVAADLFLGLNTTLQVGDLAKSLGIENPYAMMDTIQRMDTDTGRGIKRVSLMRDAWAEFAKKNPEQAKLLDSLMPASSVESIDLTLNRNDYDQFFLAYETLDADGDVVARKRLGFKTALERDTMVARLNTNPGTTRTAARSAHDVDPEQLKAFDTLKPLFENNLTAEGRAMYASMRDFYQGEYNRLWAVLKGNIDTAYQDRDGKSVDKKSASTLKQSAYLMIFGRGEITPYFPLVREGDFWLEFSMYNPVTQSTEPVKKTFGSPNERARFEAELSTNPAVLKAADGTPIVSRYKAADIAAGNFADRSMFVADTMKLFTSHNAKHAGTDKAISDEVVKELAQALVDAAPEGAMARQFHRRRNVAGYAESTDLALEKKGYSLTSASTRYKFGREIRDLQRKYREAAAQNPSRKQQLVLGELAKLGDTALSPQNSAVERAARAANKITYIYTLVGSIAGSMVNLSGLGNVVGPQLGGRYGFGAATRALVSAGKDFMGSGFQRTDTLPVDINGQSTSTERGMPTIDNYYTLQRDGTYTVNTGIGLTPEKVARAQALLPLMKALSDKNMTHTSAFFEVSGIDTPGRSRSVTERAMAFFGFPFHMVERMNRQVTAIAVFDLEMDRMAKKPTPDEAVMSDAERRTLAADRAVYQAQLLNGNAGISTAPRLTQRNIGRVMFMYKSYGIMVTTLLAKTTRQLAENMYGGDKELRNEAIRQLTGHVGATMVMAGAAGLPLFGLYAAIGNLFRDDDELRVEEATRLWMGELPYKGVINHVTGFEVADRVGLSNLLYRANRYNTDPSAEETLVTMIGGAPWSTAMRIKRGVQDLAAGETQRGLESVLPVAASNLLQTARFANEGGIRTRQGNFMYEDPTATELFGKLIGFNMAELVRRQSRASEISRIGTAVQTKRTKLMTKLFVAERTGDRNGARAAREEIQQFNDTTGRRYPEAVIRPENIEASFERRNDAVKEMVNGVSANPQVREVLVELYGATRDGVTRS